MGQDLIIPPVHDRVLYLAPRNPPLVKFRHSEFYQILPSLPPSLLPGHNNETMQSVFKLSEAQINVLKQQVKDTNKNLTTYEVVAAHVWRSACKARNLPHDQEVKLYIPVDGRLTLQNPNIPFGYFGNVLFFSSCILKASDVMFKPLGFISSKIHEAVKKMHDVEYLRSAIDYLESEPGLPVPLMGIHKTMFPNLLVNSWVKLPVQIADFGFGLPKVFGNVEIKLEGLSFLVPRTDEEDESLALAINLFAVHMPMFEKHLYEFNHIKSSL